MFIQDNSYLLLTIRHFSQYCHPTYLDNHQPNIFDANLKKHENIISSLTFFNVENVGKTSILNKNTAVIHIIWLYFGRCCVLQKFYLTWIGSFVQLLVKYLYHTDERNLIVLKFFQTNFATRRRRLLFHKLYTFQNWGCTQNYWWNYLKCNEHYVVYFITLLKGYSSNLQFAYCSSTANFKQKQVWNSIVNWQNSKSSDLRNFSANKSNVTHCKYFRIVIHDINDKVTW